MWEYGEKENKMKILIVEDDFVVRQGIRYSFEWEKYDLTICGDAANGKQGLELVKTMDPDIILTDIRMPIMDGLAFAENVFLEKPDAKIIILSGYDDFTYAKKAIHLGVYDYLLKPIDADELLKCICKLRDEIYEEEKKKNRLEKQGMFMKTYETERFGSIMEKVIKPSFPEQKEQVLKELSAIGFTFSNSAYKVLILALENFLLLTRNHTREEKEWLTSLIKGVVKETFGNGCRTQCFINGRSHFVILLGYDVVSKLYLEDCYQRLINRITEEAGFLCTISCGMEKEHIEEIYLSYQEAVSALRLHTSRIDNNVFQYSDENIRDNYGFLDIQEEEKQLMNDILKYDTKSVQMYMNAIFQKAVEEQEPFEKVNATCVRLASAVFSVLDEMGVYFREESYSYQDTLMAIQQYHSVKHLKQFMMGFMKKVSECLEKVEKKKFSSVVDQAVEYVKKNFKEEISVKSISAELFITPNYFSQIFKSQMGMNFIDYLNEVRIAYAKELLKDSRLKAYEVAEMSGYQNYKYFNTVFKKYTGYSPKEYRNGAV